MPTGNDIFLLCNSLNAWERKLRSRNPALSCLLRKAQECILRQRKVDSSVMTNDKGFALCPKCGKQTKTKVNPDTELKRFPLFCPWCKIETIIDK